MHTCDAGTVDDQGNVYVQDRVNDTIVLGGENVNSRVVKDVLFKNLANADAAVTGCPQRPVGWGSEGGGHLVAGRGIGHGRRDRRVLPHSDGQLREPQID